MDQSVLDRAVKIATRAALDGEPIERLQWLPPATTSSDPAGNWIITYKEPEAGGSEH